MPVVARPFRPLDIGWLEAGCPGAPRQPHDRPNIVFIVADDLGCYGGRDAGLGPVSPVLDGLAAGGIRFDEGYANAPVCSPTRFGLMTGRYQYRLRGAAEEPINSRSHGSGTLGLPPAHPTLPSLLREAGYRTALVGKWHLGSPPNFGPLRSGYDEFFGPMSGGVDYFSHCDSTGRHDLWEGEAESPAEGYLSDLISGRAVDVIERATPGAPFFMSLHYTAPHWPWETRDDAARPARIQNRLFDLASGNVETYRRILNHMDERASAGCSTRSSVAASPTTHWSSSRATTAASASRTTGRWSAARWT